MNKPARYHHFWAQRRSKCSLCMIFNGLSRNTFNADAIFFPDDPYISRTTVLDDINFVICSAFEHISVHAFTLLQSNLCRDRDVVLC